MQYLHPCMLYILEGQSGITKIQSNERWGTYNYHVKKDASYFHLTSMCQYAEYE